MNKKKFIPLFLVIFVLIAFTITSCKKSSEIDKQNEVEKINLDSESLIEVENYGRDITLTQTPSKVLTLGPNCTELFVALGLEDYVIGKSLINHSRGPLDEYTQGVNSIPQLNYAEATREAIITSGADFIYAIDWEISDIGCNIEEVSNYGMNVYVNSAKTPEQQYKEIRDIGKIFDISDKAEEFIKDQESRIATVSEKIINEKPVSVLVYDSGNNGIFTSSGDNFESILIELAGGENIFNDITDKQWITVSYEDVLQRNPDVILIHDYATPSIEEKINEIKSNPVLAQLDCVKNERFVTISLESVLPGSRMAYTVEYLSEAFYPELYNK